MFGSKHEPESQEAGESGHATVVVMLLSRVHLKNP